MDGLEEYFGRICRNGGARPFQIVCLHLSCLTGKGLN